MTLSNTTNPQYRIETCVFEVALRRGWATLQSLHSDTVVLALANLVRAQVSHLERLVASITLLAPPNLRGTYGVLARQVYDTGAAVRVPGHYKGLPAARKVAQEANRVQGLNVYCYAAENGRGASSCVMLTPTASVKSNLQRTQAIAAIETLRRLL